MAQHALLQARGQVGQAGPRQVQRRPQSPHLKPARATRLYVLLARAAPTAVIFRRGPSKHVALIRWNLDNDTFEVGQWLKGRIYERRSDLSPNGDRLVYFAASWKAPYHSWTAISQPPWLTALALWQKGDAWGGGGHFASQHELVLNHGAHQLALTQGKLPKKLSVQRPVWGGRGEDHPIHGERLARDGWTLVQNGTVAHDGKTWNIDPALVYERASPDGAQRLRMRVHRIHVENGPWYDIDHELDGTVLPGSDWADWDRRGDLLFTRGGEISRAPAGDLARARVLADFSSLTFEARPSPPSARRWR